jgi:hypothetical protein
MSFKTLEDVQDRAKMKASLKSLRRLKRPTPYLFKARCDAMDGDPLLLVSTPGKKLSATLIKEVRLGTRSVRGTVCREGSKLVFTTKSNVNKPQMAKFIARIGTKNAANLPLQRIEIVTPKDLAERKQQQKKAPDDGASPELSAKLNNRHAVTEAPEKPPEQEKEKARPSPRERVSRLREAARAEVSAPEPEVEEASIDLTSLRADLAQWQADLAVRQAAAAAAQHAEAEATAHLGRLGGAVTALLKLEALEEVRAALLELSALDDDPELPKLVRVGEKAVDAELLLERIGEWFEDVSEEHGWEIESLREASEERSREVAEMSQLVASVEQVLAQG